MPTVLVAGATATQNSPFSSLVVAVTIASTYCIYPRKDGQAELAWVAGYVVSLPARRQSPIPALTGLNVDITCVGQDQRVTATPTCHLIMWKTCVLTDFWPPNGPDINPVNWKIWASSLPEKAQDVNDLRRHLIDVWVGVKQSVIDDPSSSDADVSMPRFEPQKDILNIHCDINHAKHYCNKLSWNLLLNKTFVSYHR